MQTKLQLFAKELYATLQLAVNFSKPAALYKAREQMWIQYTTIKATILPPLSKNFFSELNCEEYSVEPLLIKLINEGIMDHLRETSFPVKLKTRTNCTLPTELNKDEENIICNPCGMHVCMHLRRRFLSSKIEKIVEFIECLDKMRERHDDESSSI